MYACHFGLSQDTFSGHYQVQLFKCRIYPAYTPPKKWNEDVSEIVAAYTPLQFLHRVLDCYKKRFRCGQKYKWFKLLSHV